MSEPAELKAGHPPAVKAGGKRVVTKHKHEEPDPDAYDQKYIDSLPEPPNQIETPIVISGVVMKGRNAQPSPEASRAGHEKPAPTHEKSRSPTKLVSRINQPRKAN